MLVTNLFSNNGFIITSKILIKTVGLEASVLFGELCSEYNYWKEKEKLIDGCWFYSTRENIEENTGLSEHKQRCAMNVLVKKGFLSTRRYGIPCKVYYKIKEENVLSDLEKNTKNPVMENLNNKELINSTTGYSIMKQQDVQNLNINNNKNNNKKKKYAFQDNVVQHSDEFWESLYDN